MKNYMKGDIYINLDYGQWLFDDNATFYGQGNDHILCGSFSTLYAGGGNNRVSINSGSSNCVVYGQGGNDFIGFKFATNPTIYGGAGNDTIRLAKGNAYADGGADDDLFIPLNSASDLTLEGGDGNDTFWFIESTEVSISGGDGKNIFRFDPYYLFGPYHNDVIITDLTAKDTIRNDSDGSNGSELNWYKDSSTGFIVLEDQNNNLFRITLEGITDIREVAGVTYQSMNKVATLGEIFNVQGGDVSLNSAGTAANILDSYSKSYFKFSEHGDKLQTVNASAVEQGLNITANGLANKIIGTKYDDSIAGGRGNDTLTGGYGADIFIYTNGDNKDVITDYDEYDGDKIEFKSGTVSNVSLSGNDVVFTVGKGSVTVKKGKNQDITIVDSRGVESVYSAADEKFSLNSAGTAIELFEAYTDSTFDAADYSKLKNIDASAVQDDLEILGNDKHNNILGTDYNDTISGGKGNDSINGGSGNDSISGGADSDTLGGGNGSDKLFGNDGNDKIGGGAGKDTLVGGKGNDSLYGGADADTFVYAEGDGKDYIIGFDNNDSLQITGTFETSYNSSKKEIYFKVGSTSNAITIKNFKATTFNVNGTAYKISGNKLATNNKNLTLTNSDKAAVTLGSGSQTANASSRTSAIKITGNALANTLSGGNKNDSLYGAAGNDSLNGNAGNDHLSGGDGNDTLSGMAGNDRLYGGEGNDKLGGGAGKDTLVGGKGNDSLWGGADSDLFVYANGDGKDFIIGFDNNDLLQITGTFETSYNKSKKEIYFDVGSTSNAITIKNFGSTSNFKINGTNYKISGNRLVKK